MQIPLIQGIQQNLASGKVRKWEASRHSLTSVIIQYYQNSLTGIQMLDKRCYK